MMAEATNGSHEMSVIVRWREHAREWARKHLAMATREDRGPEDYEDRRDMKSLLYEAAKAGAQLSRRGDFNNGDDSADLKKWIVGVGIVLSGAFVVGGWSLSNQMAAQTVKLDYLVETVKTQNERITALERAQQLGR